MSIIVGAVTAQGQMISFGDPYVDWPGYRFTTAGDVIGDPKITSMDIDFDKSKRTINKVVLNIAQTTGQKREQDVLVRWDSLFINTNYVDLTGVQTFSWDQSWDYFVHTDSNTSANNVDRGVPGDISGDVPGEGLFKVVSTFGGANGNVATGGYTTVNRKDARNMHPNGIDKNFLELVNSNVQGIFAQHLVSGTGTGNSSVWRYTITYDLLSNGVGGITYFDGFTIGYSPWCANDVMLGS